MTSISSKLFLITLQVDYPTRAVTIKMSDLIKSEAFAEQIGHFHETKREKGDARPQVDANESMRKYVSQWLIGAASDRNSEAPADFPTISKKMRDEPSEVFCRSGFWIAVKVFLQLGLTIELGETDGKLIYKLIILRFMSTMCSYVTDASQHNLDVDNAVEMLAKIGRRIEKLANFRDAKQPVLELAAELKVETMDRMKKLRLCLEQHFARHVIKGIKLSTQKKLKFAEHIEHVLPLEFTNYLEQRMNLNYREVVKVEKSEPEEEMIAIAYFDPNAAPDYRQLKSLNNESDTLRCLSDIENWVLRRRNEMSRDVVCDEPPTYLRDLATEYFAKAQNFYQKDPIGYSKMVLTILKIIQVSRFEHQIYFSNPTEIVIYLCFFFASTIDLGPESVRTSPNFLEPSIQHKHKNVGKFNVGVASSLGSAV